MITVHKAAILASTITLTTSAFADVSYYYVSPKALFLSEVEENQESFSYAFDAGYQWNSYFRTELGFQDLGSITLSNNDEAIYGYDLLFTGVVPLTDYSNINLGVGPMLYNSGSESETVLMARLGIEYAITDFLDLVLGYRYYGEIFEEDLYAYDLGLKFNFGKSQDLPATVVVPAPVIEPHPVVEPIPEPEPEPIPAAIVVPPPPKVIEIDCNFDVVKEGYEVIKDDHLMKIARIFDMPFNDFKALNPSYFRGRNPDLIYPGERVVLEVLKWRTDKPEDCIDKYNYYIKP